MGAIQGATEFLPVSSSGHLALYENIFGKGEADLFFDAILHLGTLLAVLLVFRADVKEMIAQVLKAAVDVKNGGVMKRYKTNPHFRLAVLIIIGTAPAAAAGFLLKDAFERLFNSTLCVGIALIATGAFLLLTKLAPKPEKKQGDMTVKDSLIIGVAQAAAITPGISRSGATICAAMFLKVDRELAGRFSFLLAVPAIIGAAIFELGGPHQFSSDYAAMLLTGFAFSFIVGAVALKALIGLVKTGKFFYFGFYCIPLGAAAIALSFIL